MRRLTGEREKGQGLAIFLSVEPGGLGWKEGFVGSSETYLEKSCVTAGGRERESLH